MSVVPLVAEFVPHDLARLVWKYVGGPVTAEHLAEFMRVKIRIMRSRYPAEWCHKARERYVQERNMAVQPHRGKVTDWIEYHLDDGKRISSVFLAALHFHGKT